MPDGPRLDLGAGVIATLRTCECSDPSCDHSRPCGMTFEHTTAPGAGVKCESGGWIPFSHHSANGWTLVSDEPLELSPSLLCTRCGRHGFVRGGKWVEA